MARTGSSGENNEILSWIPDFNTGIEVIDLQHRQLVVLLNLLINHVAAEADLPQINVIFEALTDYAAIHFSTEERIWHRHFAGDAWESAHQAEHSCFVEKVGALMAEQGSRPPQKIQEEIAAFLTRWLTWHIVESDKRMAKAVLALSPDVSLERAKEIATEQMSGAAQAMADKITMQYGLPGV